MHEVIKATKALSDETRLRMLNLLLQRECCVCEVMQVLNISQTRASRNLSLLYEAGLLKLRKEGLWSYYSIDKTSQEHWRSVLLDAMAESLKEDPTAREDLVSLEKSVKAGRNCRAD
jgi:ArsR family transcriptional regulator, arsenate/arsenite/antimonite-responsive transcriptional repressor